MQSGSDFHSEQELKGRKVMISVKRLPLSVPKNNKLFTHVSCFYSPFFLEHLRLRYLPSLSFQPTSNFLDFILFYWYFSTRLFSKILLSTVFTIFNIQVDFLITGFRYLYVEGHLHSTNKSTTLLSTTTYKYHIETHSNAPLSISFLSHFLISTISSHSPPPPYHSHRAKLSNKPSQQVASHRKPLLPKSRTPNGTASTQLSFLLANFSWIGLRPLSHSPSAGCPIGLSACAAAAPYDTMIGVVVDQNNPSQRSQKRGSLPTLSS